MSSPVDSDAGCYPLPLSASVASAPLYCAALERVSLATRCTSASLGSCRQAENSRLILNVSGYRKLSPDL